MYTQLKSSPLPKIPLKIIILSKNSTWSFNMFPNDGQIKLSKLFKSFYPWSRNHRTKGKWLFPVNLQHIKTIRIIIHKYKGYKWCHRFLKFNEKYYFIT